MSLPPSNATRGIASFGATSFRAVGLRAACRPALSAALFFAFLSCAPFVVHAEPKASSAERALFDAANRERTAHGLPAFRWDDALANAARAHALRMAEHNTLSHQFSGEPPVQDRARQAGARFSVIAENVAEGPTADNLHSSWMHSPPHRANILDHELTAVGIAVVGGDGGRKGGSMLFAVQDFSQSVANLSYEEQEKEVSALLTARGLKLVNASGAKQVRTSGGTANTGGARGAEKKNAGENSGGTNGAATVGDARKTCEMDRGWAGSRPGAVVRYEESDLSRLPDDLEKKIQSGKYRAAAVGACDPGGSRGFTRFRVAVLLF